MESDIKKCLNCEVEFNPRKGEFHCATGEAHTLPSKTYFMDDAPTDPGPYMNGVATGENRKHSRTVISNLVPEKHYVQGTERRIMPGRNVEFVRGTYTTTDAEEQFYLDRRLAIKQGGLCTKERWEEVYLTDNQKNVLRAMDLDARERRLEIETNQLLAMKQRESGPKEDLQTQAQTKEAELRNDAAEKEKELRGKGKGQKPAMVGA